ncbi:molybdopterin-binding protein [Lichenifustis flavocetrariae]|uniref:Molybdopterin-binding protein n=1 Tax=Lichenifustis flavocetrariae TaxID=2949735 RepID=A0AA41Z2V1_9HYPH|nr:molybdopterin-binding protein [Lichenifustis flavocetrariae]MCW6509340.1 molybdopterin-binding protein [Lichenifustis flavocetrariae]
MKFGPVPLNGAIGATVAHALHVGSVTLKKGEVVTGDHVAALASLGVAELMVARMEVDDVGENEAAQRLAQTIGGVHLSTDRAFTGRANLFARTSGVLSLDVEAVNRLNAIDESLTLATLPPFRAVVAGEMVATVKIIPFAVSRQSLNEALRLAGQPIVDLKPFQALQVGVLSTVLPGLKPSVIRKTVQHLADRLAIAGAPIVADETLPHDTRALSERLIGLSRKCDLVVVFGASAITDRRDVIPAALTEAGGTIEQFGMPVDPGNLLLLGRLGRAWVIGAPGCARSPKENGFDWILQRLLAGIEVTRDDIRRLGAGGLLMEIVSRPQPRLDTVLPLGSKRPIGVEVAADNDALL